MDQYPRVTDVFLRLSPKYQQVLHSSIFNIPFDQQHACNTANTSTAWLVLTAMPTCNPSLPVHALPLLLYLRVSK